MMPWKEFLLPVVILGVLVAWGTGRQGEIRRLREEVRVLEGRIAIWAEEKEEGGKGTGKKNGRQETSLRALVDQMVGANPVMTQGGMPDMREMFEVQGRLMEMSVDELVAALREVEGMGLEAQVRESVRGMFLQVLGQKDAGLLLEEFGAELLSAEQGSWAARTAVGQLAMKDPVAAEAWIDRMVREGHLEPKGLGNRGSLRATLEAGLLEVLMGERQAMAMTRMEGLAEEERRQVLEGMMYGGQVGEGKLAGYADLVRKFGEEGDFGNMVGQRLHQVTEGEETKVRAMWETMKVSGEEKGALAGQLLVNMAQRHRKTSLESLEKGYGWMREEVPDLAGKMGEALGRAAWQEKGREEALKMLRKYEGDGVGGEMVGAFLEQGGRQLEEKERRRLWETLPEGERKQELRRALNLDD